jgi:hypothetical protein
MANLTDQGAIAQDGQFQERCVQALKDYAATIMTGSTSGANYAQLSAYAQQVLGGQVNAVVVAEAVLTNSTIAGEATTASLPGCTAVPDSDIEYAITQIFASLAGVAT